MHALMVRGLRLDISTPLNQSLASKSGVEVYQNYTKYPEDDAII